MAKESESDLENRLRKYAEQNGIYVRKFTSSHAGVPDRIFTKEITLFLEIKASGEKPTALQQDEIGTICRAGGYATWVDNYFDGVAMLLAVITNQSEQLRKQCKKWNYWMNQKLGEN